MCGGSAELRPKLGTTCSDSDAGFCRMTGSRWLPVMLQKTASKSEQVATHDQHFSGLASHWPLCGGSAELRPKLGTTCSDSDAGFCRMTGSRWLPVMLQKTASKSEQVATHDQHFSGLASHWPLCGGSAELTPSA